MDPRDPSGLDGLVLLGETPLSDDEKRFGQMHARKDLHACWHPISAVDVAIEERYRTRLRTITSEARAALKSLVQGLNQADDAAGWVIETEEREDVVLEDLVHAAGHPSLLARVEAWSSW